ncbi:hypothetical protein RRG08_016569 [Elysia crispata]|uniref:Uncharacterized protein n=1 Tax=Elysia crispata TaxID=231223 RepID=A0AAE1ATH6_9GAST|nr:hypothetical protein RRG08_016569 [Elysia crispata]
MHQFEILHLSFREPAGPFDCSGCSSESQNHLTLEDETASVHPRDHASVQCRDEHGSPVGKPPLIGHHREELEIFLRTRADSLGAVPQFEMTHVIVRNFANKTQSEEFDSDAILACDESDLSCDDSTDVSLDFYVSLKQ